MLKLMYITNRPEVARIAEEAGVDRIFVDLETIGKAERQGGMDTVQSRHTLDDVRLMHETLRTADLLVRVNPIHAGSKEEIDTVIRNGADIVMLPYFKTVDEPREFLRLVGGRARTCLLLETPEAVDHLDEILSLPGVDEMHIGLNDLHLGYGMRFMFQLLSDGTVDRLALKIKQHGIPFGFGGIARLDTGALPGSYVIKEHYRLGSEMVIVSRSFCNADACESIEEVRRIFSEGIRGLRLLEKEAEAHRRYFEDNRREVVEKVGEIVEKLSAR